MVGWWWLRINADWWRSTVANHGPMRGLISSSFHVQVPSQTMPDIGLPNKWILGSWTSRNLCWWTCLEGTSMCKSWLKCKNSLQLRLEGTTSMFGKWSVLGSRVTFPCAGSSFPAQAHQPQWSWKTATYPESRLKFWMVQGSHIVTQHHPIQLFWMTNHHWFHQLKSW